MMIDDDTLKQLLGINDELFKVCKWLNEKHEIEISSRLIPLVDDLTHILVGSGQEQTTLNEGCGTFRNFRAARLTRRRTYFLCVFAHAYAASLHASYTLCRQSGT